MARERGVMLLQGDCLEKLKELADNSVDSCVCDPPYFLTNSGGSGFMGKEWDSLSVANAFAEALLKSLSPVWITDAESIALDSANINSKKKNPETNINALYVMPKSIGQNHKLSLGTFSVLESVLTKGEVLALSRELCPSLINVVQEQSDSVLYVLKNTFDSSSPNAIAHEIVLRLATNKICEELKTLHTLMADQKNTDAIEETTGKNLESKFTNATITGVKNVENIVLEKRYNVTTSSLIESRKIIQWIISSRYVRNAMATFTAIPGNIQILSERFHYQWAKEVLRVLKPGAHLLAFAGTRTYHPLAKAVESAGFEIRDQIMWIYGSGFPKSHDVSKGIDKQAGAEREKIMVPTKSGNHPDQAGDISLGATGMRDISQPATAIAKAWQGWGTALKPANEPIVVARKPLEKGLTIAENVIKWGCGAINIDASRIEGQKRSPEFKNPQSKLGYHGGSANSNLVGWDASQGRWPANILFDEAAASVLDEQTAEKQPTSRFFYVAKASSRERNGGLDKFDVAEINLSSCEENTEQVVSLLKGILELIPNLNIDSSGNNITAKSPKECTSTILMEIRQISELKIWNSSTPLITSESTKDADLSQMDGTSHVQSAQNSNELMTAIGILLDRAGLATVAVKNATFEKLLNLSAQSAWQCPSNFHPTIKPIRLMEYLINLVTPPNGSVLDPFMGSGSTGVAAKNLNREFIGIELNQEYFEIAKKRIEGA